MDEDTLFDPNSNGQDNCESGGSSDQEYDNDFTDADAAIDRMLDDLNNFNLELDANEATDENSADSDNFPPPPQSDSEVFQNFPPPPQNEVFHFPSAFSNSADRLRFSTIAIEESPEVDLDMLLEDLCSMEKELANNANISGISSDSSLTLASTTSLYSGTSEKTLFPQQNYQFPTSPRVVSPTNVTPDVRNRLESLQEELETKELTPEQQEARIKAEKIKIALEKMKQANIQKLVIKVFDDKLDTSKTMMIDTTWTVRQVMRKMVKKDDQEVDPNWALIESLPDMNMERIMEDNEKVLQTIFNWSRETTNCLMFSKRRDKYTLFRNPQNFLLGFGTSAGAAQLAEKSKDVLLQEFFSRDHTRIPEADGILWLKEGKRSWVKHYFVLRASGVYYTPKGKTKASRDLVCLAKFEHCDIYLGTECRKKMKSPTDYVFCLKHPKVQTTQSKHVYSLCVEDLKTLHLWVNAIRMAKYGYQMYEDYLTTQENVEKELSLTSLADKGMASVGWEEDNMSEQKLTVNDNHVHKAQTDTQRSLKQEPLPTEMQDAQTVRVKGKGGGGNLGSLFSNAWKKGVVE